MLKGLYLLVADEAELGNLGRLVPLGLAQGNEATHLPSSIDTKGSRKLLAPLKRVSAVLCLSSVSQERGITRVAQGERVVGSGVRGGTREGCVGLLTYPRDYGTPLASCFAPLDQPSHLMGHNMHKNNAVQMTQDRVNMLIFGNLIFNPLNLFRIEKFDF